MFIFVTLELYIHIRLTGAKKQFIILFIKENGYT